MMHYAFLVPSTIQNDSKIQAEGQYKLELLKGSRYGARYWRLFNALCLSMLPLSYVYLLSSAIVSVHGHPQPLVANSKDPSQYNEANAGTPVAEFSGKAGLPVIALAAAARKAKKTGQKYPTTISKKHYTTIFTDWSAFKHVGRLFIQEYCSCS